jgi:hypothetical protein
MHDNAAYQELSVSRLSISCDSLQLPSAKRETLAAHKLFVYTCLHETAFDYDGANLKKAKCDRSLYS